MKSVLIVEIFAGTASSLRESGPRTRNGHCEQFWGELILR